MRKETCHKTKMFERDLYGRGWKAITLLISSEEGND